MNKWITFFLTAAAVVGSCSAAFGKINKNDDHGKALSEWLVQNGGYMHASLQMRRSIPDAPFYGIEASRGIGEGEVLLEIPLPMLVRPQEEMKVGDRVEAFFENGENSFWASIAGIKTYEGDEFTYYDVLYDDGDKEFDVADYSLELINDCATVERLMEEAKLGEKSPLAPYLNYLRSQPEGQVPSAWSKAGKALLAEVAGAIHSKPIGTLHMPPLPPDLGNLESGVYDDYVTRCYGGKNESVTSDHLNFFHLLNQRGWDEIMIPVFDMMSHGNGRLLNTDHASIRNEDGSITNMVRVTASRDIPKGEELCTTYNLCANCENRYMGYGTPELLRDYGFVEGFPQRWFFEWPVGDEVVHTPEGPRRRRPIEVGFELDEVLDEEKETNEDGSDNYTLKLTWLSGKPTHPALLRLLRYHLVRLEGLSKTILGKIDPEIPEYEFQTIVKYQQAVVVAMKMALKAVGIDDYKELDCQHHPHHNDNLAKGGICEPLADVYDPLEQPEYEEWLDDRPGTCNEGEDGDQSPYYSNNFLSLERIESPYQTIEWFLNLDRNNDTCFQLDTVNQICTSYRPDYHEMVVHNTARYLETDLKRVVFVGGGDSMLLHDVLKYPTLEKVVGLEIDQFVTRSAYHHFGSQPHFDDNRVEWWFGDATKSLPMLPKDYYGSFDLVLVDLSETVASLSVTAHLSVMEVLSLLLQPKGILVKNEYPYFAEQKNVFREALHIHYYDVPYVCSQSLTMASNSIDLMRAPYTKHDVHHIFDLLDKPDIQYGYHHDYQKNHSHTQPYCIDGNADVEPETQAQSPGIMMIIEAENASVNLESTEQFKTLLEETMKGQGFEVMTTLLPTKNSADVNYRVVVTVMKEGYVVARLFPDYKYVGFDFQMWADFEKQEDATRALIEAVGSEVTGKSSSKYRIISGGMFGVENWKDDAKKRGPKILSCDEAAAAVIEAPKFDKAADLEVALLAAKKSLRMVKDSNYAVLVLCGTNADCKLADDIKEVKGVADVLTLKPCPELEGVEFTQDAFKRMADCEISTWHALDKVISTSGKKIRSIILDPNAPQPLAQIVLKICTSPINHGLFLSKDLMVAAPLLDLSETWRSVFVDKFRTEVVPMDPSFRSDLYLNNTAIGSSLMISISSSGDQHFAEEVVKYVEDMEQSLGIQGEVRNIRGNIFEGFFVQDPIYTYDNYTDTDFDQTGPFEQWMSQHPLGFQVLFQFELDSRNGQASYYEQTQQKKALKEALNLVVGKDMEYESFSSLGDGHLMITSWAEGSAILLHDGRSHVDVSLFLLEENFRRADLFESEFSRLIPGMQRTLKDTQPRGIGRPVSFLRDLGGLDEQGGPRNRPLWAKHLYTSTQ